jgi:hypothetical protein
MPTPPRQPVRSPSLPSVRPSLLPLHVLACSLARLLACSLACCWARLLRFGVAGKLSRQPHAPASIECGLASSDDEPGFRRSGCQVYESVCQQPAVPRHGRGSLQAWPADFRAWPTQIPRPGRLGQHILASKLLLHGRWRRSTRLAVFLLLGVCLVGRFSPRLWMQSILGVDRTSLPSCVRVVFVLPRRCVPYEGHRWERVNGSTESCLTVDSCRRNSLKSERLASVRNSNNQQSNLSNV